MRQCSVDKTAANCSTLSGTEFKSIWIMRELRMSVWAGRTATGTRQDEGLHWAVRYHRHQGRESGGRSRRTSFGSIPTSRQARRSEMS